MADVGMTTYTCRWCGAPYSVPTVMAENMGITKRCALGHRHSDGQTVEQALANVQRYLTDAEETIRQRNATIVNLKGQITKLKAKL